MSSDFAKHFAKHFVKASKKVPLNFLVPVEPPLRPFRACIGEQWNELYVIPVAERALIPVKGDIAPRSENADNPLFSPRVKDALVTKETEAEVHVILTIAQIQKYDAASAAILAPQ